MSDPRHHDVLVVGGGNAGISLAAKLLRDGCRNVAVVEPKQTHQYRPLLSYVASGMATLDDLRRPQADVIPDGCRWYPDEVTDIDPATNIVHLRSGEALHGTDVVVCPGSIADWDAIPGTREAMATPAAATSYLDELAAKTWTMLSSVSAGTVVFVVSNRYVPCGPVALKPLLTAADHWRRTGVLDAIEIHLLVEGAALVGEEQADHQLRMAVEYFGVRTRFRTTVAAVDAAQQTLRVTSPGGTDDLRYDALYVAPPHRAPAWIAQSGLASPESGGFVAVDPHTLQHVEHPAVWGLGDAADARTLPSGGALRRQVPVVAHNIAARRTGAPMRSYEGYTVAPVTTDRRHLLLAEYDRDGSPDPTLRFPDLVRPRRSLLLFDRYLEPSIYWRRLLRGKVS
jgi:sulfide:quinone oxidoreductase